MENNIGRYAIIPLSINSSDLAIENEMLLNYEEGELYIRKDGKNILIASSKLSAHIYDMNNPHKVTKEQIGLGNVENIIPVSEDTFYKHVDDTNNPHKVTKAQVGLGDVENFPIATVEDIVDGRSDRYITPKAFFDYIDKYGIIIDPVEPVEPDVKKGIITFIVVPINSKVSINLDGKWVEGTRYSLEYGVYQYKVEAQGYITKTGTVTLDKPNVIQEVSLDIIQPKMGTLTIVSSPSDAKRDVLVDTLTNRWQTMDKNLILPYGSYKYRITKDKYVTFNGVANLDKNEVVIFRELEKIVEVNPNPDPDDPIIDPGTIPPEQVQENEILIMDHQNFENIIVEPVGTTVLNMKYDRSTGLLSGHKKNETYRITLIPSNIAYKVEFMFIDTNTIGKFIKTKLEPNVQAKLNFKIHEDHLNRLIAYRVGIKSALSSIREDSNRYVNINKDLTPMEIYDIAVDKLMYRIVIHVQLHNGYMHELTTTRTEYLSDINFVIQVNEYTRVKLIKNTNPDITVGLNTDIPLAAFTTMTIPKRPKAVVEELGEESFVYVPKTSKLHVFFSEKGKPPRMVSLDTFDEKTPIDLNKI